MIDKPQSVNKANDRLSRDIEPHKLEGIPITMCARGNNTTNNPANKGIFAVRFGCLHTHFLSASCDRESFDEKQV